MKRFKITREDGVLRSGKNVPKGTIIENPTREEITRWSHFNEGYLVDDKGEPLPEPEAGSPAKETGKKAKAPKAVNA